jgi:DTW domain-containing protein
VLHGVEFEPDELSNALTSPKTFLLYPSSNATDCTDCVLDTDTTVIVVDGTWDEAGKIVYRNPLLKTFPCLTFSQPLRSKYRIRKQPRDNYLSTIESVAHLLKINAAALGQLEKCQEYDRLLAGFDSVIQRQLKYIPEVRVG